MNKITLYLGDCLEVLKNIPDNQIDSLVTDPPAGISFMGKAWDSDKGGRDEWIKWMASVMKECARVMKPGAHGLVWAIPRTSHWTATALEDAGFEIRDVVTHLFGSGFPKSMDISKAIDKAAGVEGPIIGKNPAFRARQLEHDAKWETAMRPEHKHGPATDLAKQWQGWGTALKPASEHWILIRKPCSEKTVAKNVEKWGCGAINIDAGRIDPIGMDPRVGKNISYDTGKETSTKFGQVKSNMICGNVSGRFPANLVFTDGEATDALEAQNEGASRFFYCAKISTSERNQGMELETKSAKMSDARPGSPDLTGKFPDHDGREKTGNHHPTVKPKKLMGYLIKLITPPNGVVLDPFMGSGSTGMAAKESGFRFIGIEREKEYLKISKARIQSIDLYGGW